MNYLPEGGKSEEKKLLKKTATVEQNVSFEESIAMSFPVAITLKSKARESWGQVPRGLGTIAGLGCLVIQGLLMAPSAQASDRARSEARWSRTNTVEHYEDCSEGLQELGLTAEETATACAHSLFPQDIATCATAIAGSTTLAPQEIVATCHQVRRPVALGICVEQIQDSELFGDGALVLETCRRSLLPDAFANCTVGLASTTDLKPESVLMTCLEGEEAQFEFPVLDSDR
jgi:hypothetical protein